MNHIGLSSLLTTLTTATLGLFVYFRDSNSRLYRLFFYYSLSIAFWSFFVTVQVLTDIEWIALTAAKLLNMSAAFIPVFFLHFVNEFSADRHGSWTQQILPWLYGIAVSLAFVAMSGFLVSHVSPRYGLKYLMVPNPGYVCLFIFFIICVVWGLAKLLIAFKNAEGLRRNQIKYLLFGSMLGYTGGLNNFLIIYDINVFPLHPFGNYAIAIYVMATAYAIAQYRLLDINVVIKKSLIYASLLLVLLVPCYLLLILGQQVAFGTINYTFSMSTLLLLIVVGFLFPKVRFRTEEALEKALFQKRVDYRDTLVRSSKEMVSIVDLEHLSDSLVRTVARALGIEKASLYLLDEAKGFYNLNGKIGLDADQYLEMAIPRDDLLIRYLQKSRQGVVKEELEMAHNGRGGDATAKRMGELEAEISIPIISKDKLIGVLNLGHKEEREIYSNEDLELLSTLANQAAIAIENARLYQNLKQSQDTLRRADRLSSLGLLTAGLAHEIRNPLVAIRTFTQLLPERYDDAEFREGFQGLALKEVDRICGLITDLLSFARPSRPNVAEESINDVVDGISRILETEAKEKSVEITRDFAASLPKVWIDREQMKQVFMNLILNAIQAMKEGGLVFISTRPYSKNEAGQPGRYVQIEIRDTGVGIPEENLDHIFDPFFTSKDEGSGLGLSISHQIVQEHGGYVTVESKLGTGTSFFINLPVGKPVRQANNGHAQTHEANLSH
jgi:signal transduction histidine kinase